MAGNKSAFEGYPNKSHWKFRGQGGIKNQLKKFLPGSIKVYWKFEGEGGGARASLLWKRNYSALIMLLKTPAENLALMQFWKEENF